MPKILITRSRKQSKSFADALERASFTPIFFPTIRIRPMDDLSALEKAIEYIRAYDWVIFSSVNAVDVFFNSFPLKEKTSSRPLWGRAEGGGKPRIAAIGSKTAASLRSRGVDVDFVPEKFVGESLLEGLGDVADKYFLLPRAKVARDLLPREILSAGGIVHEIAIYETVQAKIDAEGLSALREGVDAVTFTSPSTVKNFIALTRSAGLNPLRLPKKPLFACIGPVTGKAAREAGFAPLVVAKEYTTDGLVEILLKHRRPERSY